MPTIHSTVRVQDNFAKQQAAYHQLARTAVFEGAKVGGAVAAAEAAERSKSGTMASIRVSSASRTYEGWEASFLSPVYYAWFQNWGTLGNRTRKLRAPPRGDRTREPGTGIKPMYFLDRGRDAGRRRMVAIIRKGI